MPLDNERVWRDRLQTIIDINQTQFDDMVEAAQAYGDRVDQSEGSVRYMREYFRQVMDAS